MIEVKPKETFTFSSPNTTPLDREKMIRDLTDIINRSAPYLSGIVIHNNTKTVLVTMVMKDHTLHITLKNPNDEIFNLEDE